MAPHINNLGCRLGFCVVLAGVVWLPDSHARALRPLAPHTSASSIISAPPLLSYSAAPASSSRMGAAQSPFLRSLKALQAKSMEVSRDQRILLEACQAHPWHCINLSCNILFSLCYYMHPALSSLYTPNSPITSVRNRYFLPSSTRAPT